MEGENAVIACSGGFDCLHSGHLNYLRAAAKHGKVLVILNTDEWLIRKKGYAFMDWVERRDVLSELKCVYDIVKAKDDDGTVCESLRHLIDVKMFGKGGDRTSNNTAETYLCGVLNIKMIFGLGGNKTQSSSQLVANVQKG